MKIPSLSIPIPRRKIATINNWLSANADVKKTLDMIKTILKTKDIFIDERKNLLVLRDTPEVIRLAEKLIATQDLPDAEVELEVEILEINTSRLQNLGLQFPRTSQRRAGHSWSVYAQSMEQS